MTATPSRPTRKRSQLRTARALGPVAWLRLDLLEHAAGGLLGGWLHGDVKAWDGQAAALLLVRAGADQEMVQAYAEHVREYRDRESGRPGIGNPQPRTSPDARDPGSPC